MKTRKLAFFGLGAILLSAASCSNDNIMSEPNEPLKEAQSFYIPISVNGFQENGGTRAIGDYEYDPNEDPNFDEGIDEENKVNSVSFVFYDALGQKVGTAVGIKTLVEGNAKLESENALYTGIIQVDIAKGKNVPSYVLAFVNPSSSTNFVTDPDDEFSSLINVEQSKRKSLISDDTDKLFAMSNSVYYGNDEVTGADNVRIMATPIKMGKIFNSKKEAEDAIKADAEASYVDIYVERYASKVNFSISTKADGLNIENVENVKDIDGKVVNIKFVPEVWAVNAVEDESYITKNFFAQIADGNTFDFTKPASYDEVNKKLVGWYWNSPTNHRSYWGQSPGYYLARYPRVADDIVDNRTNKTDQTDRGGYELRYYSYDQLTKAKGTGFTGFARGINPDGTSMAIYTRENTVSGQALADAKNDPLASPKAAIASVVMVGYYQVENEDGVYDDFGGNFYITGNATNGYTFYNEEQMTNFFINNTIRLAKDANGTPFFDYKKEENQFKNAGFLPNEKAAFTGCFTIKHPSENVRGNLVMDSRYVTLQLTEAAQDKVYAKIGDQYQLVTEDNIDLINQQIMNVAGTAYGYNNGKAFFNIPIQHLGYQRNDNPNKEVKGGANGATFDWTKTQSGDFGVVRNHIYTINASTISGLGNAIPNPDDPIVPPADPEEYWIGARIVVLNWAVVPTQSVEL